MYIPTQGASPKARPILMSAPMVRALLEGRKTQTRRIIKPQPESPGDGVYFDAYNGGPQWNWWAPDNRQYLSQIIRCPYGKPGDLLWVRETWATVNSDCGPGWAYRANGSFHQPDYDGKDYGAGPSFNYKKYPGDYVMWYSDLIGGAERHAWKPSIHMPRWASRLTLELTDVRVERLHDICEEDAKAEGMEAFGIGWRAWEGHPHVLHARHAYQDCWKAINGPDSWDANPWCWALTFDVHQQNVDMPLGASKAA